jgi:hypothetical protein
MLSGCSGLSGLLLLSMPWYETSKMGVGNHLKGIF